MKTTEFKFYTRTYCKDPANEHDENEEEGFYDDPRLPITIRAGDAVRMILGAQNLLNETAPAVHVQRRINGWAIAIHSLPNAAPSGTIYLIDDGRSFFIPQVDHNEAPPTVALASHDMVYEIDKLGYSRRPKPNAES